MNGQKSELSISLLICMYARSILASIIIIKLTKLSITYFYFEHTGLTSTIWVMLFIIFIFVVRWRILRRCRGLKWYLRLQSQDRLVVCVCVCHTLLELTMCYHVCSHLMSSLSTFLNQAQTIPSHVYVVYYACTVLCCTYCSTYQFSNTTIT